MATVIINDSHLTNIANAIRGKNGGTATYKPSEMGTAITNIKTVPSEAFVIGENQGNYKFAYNNWNWFIEQYGNNITTNNIVGSYMFTQSSNLETIPFELNIKSNANSMFTNCKNLKSIGNISFPESGCTAFFNLFYDCEKLRNLPNITNFFITATTGNSQSGIFSNCYSLRTVSNYLSEFYKNVPTTKQIYASNSLYYELFNNCYALDEVNNISVVLGKIASGNAFYNTFTKCYRLKNITFQKVNNQPVVAQWSGQTIDLSSYIGYTNLPSRITTDYNSGIKTNKKVNSATTYQNLKNDPDWFTDNVAYSRYNHDSALATIQSLPDTSAYLATAGGTNTIKFKSKSGSSTEGGAINTLTEEEIAIATAKGWTITFI